MATREARFGDVLRWNNPDDQSHGRTIMYIGPHTDTHWSGSDGLIMMETVPEYPKGGVRGFGPIGIGRRYWEIIDKGDVE
jgi:hypothetical protein